MYKGKLHRIEVWKVTYSRRYITYLLLRLQLNHSYFFLYPYRFYPQLFIDGSQSR